jgi:hypothetical protein
MLLFIPIVAWWSVGFCATLLAAPVMALVTEENRVHHAIPLLLSAIGIFLGQTRCVVLINDCYIFAITGHAAAIPP